MSILPTASPSARMIRCDFPTVAPGQCAITGQPTSEDGFVDTGLDFDFYGRVYFCKEAVVEMANLFGLADANKVSEVEQESESLADALIDAQERIRQLEAVIYGLRNLDSAIAATSSMSNPFELITSRQVTEDSGNGGTSSGESETRDSPFEHLTSQGSSDLPVSSDSAKPKSTKSAEVESTSFK